MVDFTSKATSIANYLFTFIAEGVILVWFIVYGINATGEKDPE